MQQAATGLVVIGVFGEHLVEQFARRCEVLLAEFQQAIERHPVGRLVIAVADQLGARLVVFAEQDLGAHHGLRKLAGFHTLHARLAQFAQCAVRVAQFEIAQAQ